MSRDDLGELLRELGEREPDAPPFRRVWRAAVARRDARRPRRRFAYSALALAAAASLVVVLLPAPAPDGSDGVPAETAELARALSDWSGPLDFLLEPPGGGLVGLEPVSPALRVPAELPSIEFEEIL